MTEGVPLHTHDTCKRTRRLTGWLALGVARGVCPSPPPPPPSPLLQAIRESWVEYLSTVWNLVDMASISLLLTALWQLYRDRIDCLVVLFPDAGSEGWLGATLSAWAQESTELAKDRFEASGARDALSSAGEGLGSWLHGGGTGRQLRGGGSGESLLSATAASAAGGDAVEHAMSARMELAVLLLGLAAIPLCLRVLHIFGHQRTMGVLIIIVSKMLDDVVLFLCARGPPATRPGTAPHQRPSTP